MNQSRGRKRKPFRDLTKKGKTTRCRVLSQKEPLDLLLKSAMLSAKKNKFPSIAKMINHILKGGEEWAQQSIAKIQNYKETSVPSEEKCLTLKTSLGLSRSKYEGLARFTKAHFDTKLLLPWKTVSQYCESIIPPFSSPNWDQGYLSSRCTIRDLVTCDVTRISELDEVRSNIMSYNRTSINCTLYATAGPDSATGFSHYNMARNLAKDDSLLSEHFMSLMLKTEQGEVVWRNPNPQSDCFCRIRSMSWVKESDSITKNFFEQFFTEVDDINNNPISVEVGGATLNITMSALYTMIDGKVANAIVGNRDTHACPLCANGADDRIGPSYFHSRLNSVEWLIRMAAKKSVEGHPALTHPEVKAKARHMADQLEACFGMNINRPKIGGSGSSNTGNTARRLLSDPARFSEVLGIDEKLVKNLRLISCLALSNRQIDGNKVAKLYLELEQQIFNEFTFVKKLPPCIHKYGHLADFVTRLVNKDSKSKEYSDIFIIKKFQPFPMNFVDEQSGERCHKIYKFVRPHLARQTTPEENMYDLMKTALARSDPKIACLVDKSTGGRKNRRDEDFEKEIEQYTIQSDKMMSSDANYGDDDDSYENDDADDDDGNISESGSDSDC